MQSLSKCLHEKMAKMKVSKKSLFSLLHFAVSFSSFVFVTWQITNCVGKYIQKPKGTTLSIEKTTELPFPAITVCRAQGINGPYNEKGLKKCGVR